MSLLLQIIEQEIGTKEIPGSQHNPRILQYAHEAGETWVKTDETSWCALCISWCITQLPEFMRPKLPSRPGLARSWLNVGVKVPSIKEARPGDLAIFWRDHPESWKGHIGIVKKVDKDKLTIVAGNERNAVRVTRYDFSKLIGIRRV